MVAFQLASESAPRRSSDSITCSSPEPSRIVAKHSLPPVRESKTRPTTPTRSPVATSGARSAWAARTSAIIDVRAKPAGYGSMPSARNRSSLPRRMRICSGRSALLSAMAASVSSVTREGYRAAISWCGITFEHQPQPDQRQPWFMDVDEPAFFEHDRRQAPGGNHNRGRAEFGHDALGDAVDLGGEPVDDARLQ